jgi:hypothetical protein
VLSFLNPAVLYALAAAAIPLLIHLLNRRKIKRIPFSTIQFLKRLEKRQMRNLRIRQLLLLLLRTLIILLIVAAFARPTLNSGGGGGILSERSPIEAVIILDNSLSLNEARLTGSLLDKMRQAFSGMEQVFQSGDRITVILATIPREVLIKQENYQANLWERVLQKTQSNYLKSDLDNAILLALEQLRQSVYSSREIYLISDFQKSAFSDAGQFAEILEQPQYGDIKLFLFPIRHENFENISIDSVEVVNRLIEENQALRIKAYLRNHHPEKYLNTLTSVILNENRVSQQKVNLPPGQTIEAEYQLTLTESGFVEGRIETESDALQEDNRRYFNFYVPRRIKTLHLFPDPAFSSFIPLIIKPAVDRGIFEYRGELLAAWTGLNFMEYDMIILEGINQMPETLALRLKPFLENGGGVLVIPGDKIITPLYENLFQQLLLGDILEQRGKPGETGQFLTLQDVEWKHPIFEGLFEKQDQQLNPIEVYAGYRVKPGKNTETLIQLSDRSPFLLESVFNNGVVFFLSAPLQLAWSQLPLKGFVVPLVYRMIYFAGTQKIVDRQRVKCGNVFQQQFSNLEAPYEFQIMGSREMEIKLTPRFRGSNVFLEFRETELPGNYRLLYNDNILSIISVNPWKEESQLLFYGEDDIRDLLPGANYLNSLENMANEVQNRRFGEELWKHFLIAAFILLILEMILARTGAKKEFSAEEGEEAVFNA